MGDKIPAPDKSGAQEAKEDGDLHIHQAPGADGEGADDGDEPHDDADQDKQMIMDMLTKHGALAEAMDEGALKMAGDMLQSYKEMGYSEDEAMKCAAHSMKLAKHMQAKQSAGDANPPVDDNQKAMAQNEDEGSAKIGPKGEEYTENEGSAKVGPKGEEYTESAKKTIFKLQANIAKLTESLKKFECEKHLDTVLKNSGLERALTKRFRETIGTPKSVEQIDRDLKFYIAAIKEAQNPVGVRQFLQLEKVTETSGSASTGLSGFMID